LTTSQFMEGGRCLWSQCFIKTLNFANFSSSNQWQCFNVQAEQSTVVSKSTLPHWTNLSCAGCIFQSWISICVFDQCVLSQWCIDVATMLLSLQQALQLHWAAVDDQSRFSQRLNSWSISNSCLVKADLPLVVAPQTCFKEVSDVELASTGRRVCILAASMSFAGTWVLRQWCSCIWIWSELHFF